MTLNISIYCPHCHQHTHLQEGSSLQSVDGRKRRLPAIAEIDGGSWWIGVCNSCHGAVLVLNDGMTIYPEPRPTPTNEHIPADLATDLNEAKLCHSVSCHHASAVMSRRCIQRACVAKGANKDDQLVKQVKTLADQGVITKDLAEWATVIRFIGNDGAHPNDKSVSAEESKDCLDLAEQFLHVTFVAPAVAQSRRAKLGK